MVILAMRLAPDVALQRTPEGRCAALGSPVVEQRG